MLLYKAGMYFELGFFDPRHINPLKTSGTVPGLKFYLVLKAVSSISNLEFTS
jgi:hypothetical protein